MPFVDYNSQIAEVLNYRTLAQLRTNVAERLGFASQSGNLPTGMLELLNNFLRSANTVLYKREGVPRNKRIFTWTLIDGTRFYGLNANEETGTGVGKPLNQYKVDWVGVQRDDVWTQLVHGIAPELYGRTDKGMPTRYQIRQSIELYPVPDSTVQYLRIVGDFGIQPFSADGDYPSVDDELVFLMALYLAKRHYRQDDAQDQLQIMEATLRQIVAGTHQTKRYIMGSQVQALNYAYPQPTVPFAP